MNLFSPCDASATKSPRDIMTDMTREKDEKIRELAAKVQELENFLKNVQKENQEYVQLVQELSTATPGNDQVQQIIKRKISFPGFQSITEKNLTIARKDNIQIAHIRPFSSDVWENTSKTRDEHRTKKQSSLGLPSSNLIEFSPDFERQTSLATTLSTKSLSETPSSMAGVTNFSSNEPNKRDTATPRKASNRGERFEDDILGMSSYHEPDVIFA